nr:hypothetical protein [Tanacetum cinerariifolium]
MAGDNIVDDAAVSTPVNTASASRTFIPPHDPLMPALEDTAKIQTTGIFGNTYDEDDLETNNYSYADESVGAEADFNNMEPSTVVSLIPTTIVHSNYPKAQIIGDPTLAVLTKAKVKKVNDEVRIQALVDGKRVNIKESSIRRILRLDDAEGTSCLTNTEIFEGLARMGSTMASAIICLATNQKFNFSRYILLSLVKNIEAGVSFFMFPRFVQLIINHQLGDITHYKDIFDTPSLTKKVFANMKSVCTGFFGEVTPLFDNMLVQAPKEVGILQADAQPIPIPTEPSTSKPQKKHKPKRKHIKELEDSLKLKEMMDLCTNLSNKVLNLESEVIDIKSTYKGKIKKLESMVERLKEENRGRKVANIDADVEINLEKVQAGAYNLDMDHQEQILSMLDIND